MITLPLKAYPDMTELFASKEARRLEIERLPIIERLRIAKRLQQIGRAMKTARVEKEHDPNWTVLRNNK